MRKLLVLLVVGPLVVEPAQAQRVARPFSVGPQVSWGDDADVGIGIRYENGLNSLAPGTPLRFIGSFDWFFPGSDVTYFEFNFNVVYQFDLPGSRIGPYTGGGLNLARISNGRSDTEVGLNLLGGLRFPSNGRLIPFLEARLELSGGEQFVLTGGILF